MCFSSVRPEATPKGSKRCVAIGFACAVYTSLAAVAATAAPSDPSALPQGERVGGQTSQRATTSPARIDRLRMRADAGRDAGALAALLTAAQSGEIDAQRAVGELLLRRGDVSEVKQGVNWLERAAQRGDQRAMLALGKAWLFGARDVPPDHVKARAWFDRIDSQNPQAAYYLGLIDRGDNGGTASYERAMKHFRFAAERGVPEAMYLLGNGYAQGEGVDHDPREAMRWYMRAAYLDHPLAIQELAYAFARGDTLLPQSDLQAANMRAAIAHALRHPKAAP